MKATSILHFSKLLQRFQAKINIFHKFNNATHTSAMGYTVTSHDHPDLIRV